MPELAERFRLERVSKNPAVFDERKLRHMNGLHLRELGTRELTRRLEHFTGRSGLHDAVAIAEEKIQTLADFWPLVSFVFDGPVDDPAAFERVLGKDGALEALAAAREALAGVEPFTVAGIEESLRAVVERLDTKPGQVFQPIRVALAGQTVSPASLRRLPCWAAMRRWRRIDRTLERAGSGVVPR